MMTVEDRLPVLVAREIAISDEEPVDAVLVVLAQDALDIVGAAAAGFAPLHVDDGAERALERTAAPGIEGRHVADGLAHRVARQERRHRVLERRQIGDVIADRLERACGGIAHHLIHATLGLAGKQRDAHIESFLQVVHHRREHRQHAGDMEAADDHRDAGRAQRLGDMQRTRILVRLHADQADKAEIAVVAHVGDDAVDAHPGIGFVNRRDLNVDIGPENLPLGAIVEQAVDGRQRIRRHRRAEPADDIAVVVVMRGLYRHDAKAPMRAVRLHPLLIRQHAAPGPSLLKRSLKRAAKRISLPSGSGTVYG